MEFLKEKKLFCRFKSIVSSLYGIILWSTTTSTSAYSMQITKQYWPLSPGLKTLIYSQEDQSPTHHHHPFVIHSHMISSSSKSLPPSRSQSLSSNTCSSLNSSSFSSMLDDLIGTDSGVCLGSNEEEIASRMRKLKPDYDRNLCKRDQDQCEITKKYPPTMPLLARTGNLLGHMPWILTRQYSDGRLILREERLKHHEYFEFCRENGRLILNLVALDHTVPALEEEEEEEEEDLELQDLELIQEEERENTEEEEEGEEFKNMKEKSMAASWASSVPKSCLQYEIERADRPKCFTYAGRMMTWESYVSCT